MATPSFLAIKYKSRSIESLFSGSGLNTFPYTLVKPEKTQVMAFREDDLDTVLGLIGLTRENITGYVETERQNIRLVNFNTVYEYAVTYDSTVNQSLQQVYDQCFIEMCKRYPDRKFDVYFTNNASVLNQVREYPDPDALHIYIASIGNSGGYDNIRHDPDLPEIVSMGNFLMPEYIHPDAIIKVDNAPAALIKGKKIVLMLYVANYLNTSEDGEVALERRSAIAYMNKTLDAVFRYINDNPDIFARLESVEKEYKFREFLSKLVSKRVDTQAQRLKQVQVELPATMSRLTELVNEEQYLMSIVNALNPDGEKDRLMKEISIIRKSPDVKDIMFEEDALVINMKHVMLPYHDEKNTVLHCGELTFILPFDNKKDLLVLRSDYSRYPEKMKHSFKTLKQPHPNVFDSGKLCYGNTAETFAQLRGLFDISSLFIMVNNFLHVYNPKSPTVPPNLFPRTTDKEAETFYAELYPEEKTEAAVSSYSDAALAAVDDEE